MNKDLLKKENENTPVAFKGSIYKYEYHISGMYCPACELVVEKKIEKLEYVKNVNAVLSDEKVYLETETVANTAELLTEINGLINPHGYMISFVRIKHKVNIKDLAIGFC